MKREPFLVAVVLVALFYVAASLSPSSYAIVLRSFEVQEDGLLFGWPQFIRSDEYAVWTPTLQAVVANDFGPVNETSLYREKFRSLSSMPIRDWGLIFKPEFWSFFVLSPARAYSAYHVFHALAFLIGWSLFFRCLGVGKAEAALASLVLFWSAWAQVWWTSLAPILALAPIFGLVGLVPMRAPWRIAAAFYVTAVWLLDGLFYPPLILAASLSVGLAILAFRPEVLRPWRVLQWALGTLAGAGVAAYYLWDPILLAAGSVVHGERNLAGGAVPWQDWLGAFQPSFGYRGWRTIYGSNTCESSDSGSILWLLLLVFTPFSSWRALMGDAAGRARLLRVTGLLLLFLAVTLWMLLPIPAVWGKLLLWHLTPPSRLLLLPGLLSLILALFVLPRLELRFSLGRAAIFSLLIALGWAYTERGQPSLEALSWLSQVHKHADLFLIPLIFLLPLIEALRRRWASPSDQAPLLFSLWRPSSLSPISLLAAAAAANLFFFGPYNPVQSTRVIFEKQDSPQIEALRAMQATHPRGWLVVGGVDYFGSILNGLGFRSVNHSLLNPEVEQFAAFFPRLPPARLHKVFDRYANIQVSPYRPPYWSEVLKEPITPIDNSVLVPPEPFLPPMAIELASQPGQPGQPAPSAVHASTRLLSLSGRQVEIEILGPIHGLEGNIGLTLLTDPPAYRRLGSWRVPPISAVEDYGAGHYSRLVVRLMLMEPPAKDFGWCVTLHDPVEGDLEIAPLATAGRSICP